MHDPLETTEAPHISICVYTSAIVQLAILVELLCCSVSSVSGDNVEELFSRIASVTFERVMKSEIEATNSIQESTNQLAQNSSLISETTPIQLQQSGDRDG